jgi:hypothetical protein
MAAVCANRTAGVDVKWSLRIVGVEVQLGGPRIAAMLAHALRSSLTSRPESFDIKSNAQRGSKVGPWSVMLPHAPLRRVFIVTLSGALLVGLLNYVEYGCSLGALWGAARSARS